MGAWERRIGYHRGEFEQGWTWTHNKLARVGLGLMAGDVREPRTLCCTEVGTALRVVLSFREDFSSVLLATSR